jgi:TolA-binding protein
MKSEILVSLLLLALLSGCSRWLDRKAEDRRDLATGSCVTCHTNDAALKLLAPPEEGSGGGGGGG